MPGSEVEKQDLRLLQLGNGINSLTGYIGPQLVEPLLNVIPPTTTPNLSISSRPYQTIKTESKVFTSMQSLLKTFNSEVSLPIDVLDIAGKLSSNNQSSAHDVYLMLSISTTDETKTLEPPCQLKESVSNALIREDFSGLRENGDCIINNITFGRNALVIIRFHLKTKAEQTEMSASLSTHGPVNAALRASGSSRKDTTETEYSVYSYSQGMGYIATGIFKTEEDINTYIQKVGQENVASVQPIPIAWSSLPFSTLASQNCRLQALEFEQRISRAKIFYQSTLEATKRINNYLLDLYALNDEDDVATWALETQTDQRAITIQKLRALKKNLLAAGSVVNQHACNVHALNRYELQINCLLAELEEIAHALPEEFDLPVAHISSEMIRNIKHHHGEDEFNLQFPSEAKTTWTQFLSPEAKIIKAKTTALNLLANTLDHYLHAMQHATDALEEDFDKNIAKFNFHFTIAENLLTRAKQISLRANIKQLFEIKQILDLFEITSNNVGSVGQILSVLCSVQQGTPAKQSILGAVQTLQSALTDLIQKNSPAVSDPSQPQPPSPLNTNPSDYTAIVKSLQSEIVPQLAFLTHPDSGIEVIHTAFSTDKPLSEDKQTSEIYEEAQKTLKKANDCIEALNISQQNLFQKIQHIQQNHSLETQQQLIEGIAQFYRILVATKSSLQQADKSTLNYIRIAGANTAENIRKAYFKLQALNSLIDAATTTFNDKIQKPMLNTIFAHLFLKTKNEITNVQHQIFSAKQGNLSDTFPGRVFPSLTLKQHRYCHGFNTHGHALVRHLQDGTRMPVGISPQHLYLKPSRPLNFWGFFANRREALPPNSSVCVYGKILRDETSKLSPGLAKI